MGRSHPGQDDGGRLTRISGSNQTPCERLRRAQIDIRNGFDVTLDVVAAADNGDEIADAALRRVYAEMTEYNIEPSATLKAYAVKAMRRGPVTRGPGRNAWFDNWRRWTSA